MDEVVRTGTCEWPILRLSPDSVFVDVSGGSLILTTLFGAGFDGVSFLIAAILAALIVWELCDGVWVELVGVFEPLSSDLKVRLYGFSSTGFGCIGAETFAWIFNSSGFLYK